MPAATFTVADHGNSLPCFVAYYRVSTEKQGESGLGLEAQRQAVAGFLNGRPLLAEFTETESGARSDRPQLAAALALCRKRKARLVVAKLDRLSRNVAFLSALMESKVEFVATDNPHATRLTVHILAAVAEHEREMISARTKAALAVARERLAKEGKRLGHPRMHELLGKGAATNKARAVAFAHNIVPVIRQVQQQGAASLRAVARELSARGVRTARGNTEWSAVTVGAVLRRAAAA